MQVLSKFASEEIINFLKRASTPAPIPGPVPVKNLFPSPEYLKLVQKTNDKWIEFCLNQSLYHSETKTRVHILGTLPVNIPKITTIPFSSQMAFMSQSEVLIDKLWVELNDKLEPNNQNFTLLINETVSQTNWLVDEYKPFYDKIFKDNKDFNIENYLRNSKLIIQNCNKYMEIGLDIPQEWIQIMESSNIVPYLEEVFAINALSKYVSENEKIKPKVSCIAMDPSQEYIRFNDTLQLLKSNPAVKQSTNTLQESLADFYENCYNLSIQTISEIKTKSIATDSIIQKMVIQPNDMKLYKDILSQHSESLGEFKLKLEQKEAREIVISEHIKGVVGANLDGGTFLVMVDRELVPKLKLGLWNAGFE
jgi:hypothetical protein